MVINQEKGEAFEQWIYAILKKYFPSIKNTHTSEFYDLEFDYNNKKYIIECKCAKIYHNNKFGNISYRKEQFINLLEKKAELGKDGEVFYINGTFLNNFDAYPFITQLSTLSRPVKRNHDSVRVHIMFLKLLKGIPLRNWIAEKVRLKPYDIEFPEFRHYIKHLYGWEECD